MSERTRPWLLGLTVGFLLAAGLFAVGGPGLPARAQSGRAAALVPPLEPYVARGILAQGVAPVPPVPAGKLLVVESVLANLGAPSGQHPLLRIGVPGDEIPIPTIQQGSFGIDFYGPASPAVRLYLPSGPIAVRVPTTALGNAEGEVIIVGHLVPTPAAP
jgi:hypothetical protein